MRGVVGEVGDREDHCRHRRGAHEHAPERDRGHDQHDHQRQVEAAHVAHEVLVVRAVGRHPMAAAAGEVVVERPGRELGPGPDDEVADCHEGEHETEQRRGHAAGRNRGRFGRSYD